MSTITITLSDDRFTQLHEVASRLRVAPEELLLVSLEELLARPEDEFCRALDFVLNKNAELYQRLA